MATINHHLEYQIRTAKDIIDKLPDEQKVCVEAYINNIKECLNFERDKNKKYQDWFNKLKYFIRH